MAVLIQEAHLPVGRLAKARDLVHRLLPAYCMFAGRRRTRLGQTAQIQVVTLVHVYMAARASLLNIEAQYDTVAQDAPGALEQVHFIRITEPRSDITLLLGNTYQFQASQPAKQEAMLGLVSRVVERWSPAVDLVVIGGDFNASCRPRVGYVDAEVTRRADFGLHEWMQQVGLTCEAPQHATWQSINESRCAVLDCFFWQSRTGKVTIQDAEGFLSPDPRLDHDPVRVSVACDTIGPMPPLEALRVPERLRMREWRTKKSAWQDAVTQSLNEPESEAIGVNRFAALERIKRLALDCARTVLGTTGGRTLRIIPHNSKEARRLKERLTLLRVVRREIHARKEQHGQPSPPSKAMRRAWDAGLYPQPAEFRTLTELWHPHNQVWTEEWLRMLRRQSAITTEEWHDLRRRELAEAAERERLSAINRFYTGRELQKLLHPRAPAPHSPQLFTDIPDTVVVSGDEGAMAAFRAAVGLVEIRAETPVSAIISGLRPADLDRVLCLVEQGGLEAKLQGQRRLVHSVSDRLCAWESDLAMEAKATKARCSGCGGGDFTPVTQMSGDSDRVIRWWCNRCSGFRRWTVSEADYAELPFCTDGIPRVPPHAGETLRGAISMADFEFLLALLPNLRAPGPDELPFELLKHAPDGVKRVILDCINSILTGEAIPPRSWLGGLISFLLKKDAVLDISGYRPVCLLDTVYKVLSAIVTDRLYRLAERHGLQDPSQEGFRRLHSTQRQVQSLHWAIQEAAARREHLFCCYLDFANAFNSVDHAALWRWLKELNVPDIDLLQSLYSGAYYNAGLPYGRSAEVALARGQKQGDKSSPLLFGLVFNALLLALKATGVGHRTMSGLRSPARGFADDLAIVASSAGDLSRLLQVVADFCVWSGMRIKREKSVITGFDFRLGTDLPTAGILYDGAPLTDLAAEEAFAYLGVRASLVDRQRRQGTGKRRGRPSAPCLSAEKEHIMSATTDMIAKIRRHSYLLSQMVPAMHMVTTSRFRYSAPLVPWTDAELNKLHAKWMQVHRAAWRLTPGFASAPLMFPSDVGGCPVAHPVVPMVQALAKHVEQLVALPDELRETCIRRFRMLCESCGCNNERELASALAEERKPRACPLARLFRACGQLRLEIKLPACLSLGLAGRDTSWYALLMHLRQKAAQVETDQQLAEDVDTVARAWAAIRRRFRRRGVRTPRQLILDPRATTVLWLVPERMGQKSPQWLEPLRRALRVVETRRLFPRLSRAEGAHEAEVHQALLSDVIHGLRQHGTQIESLFADERWNLVQSSAPRRSWLTVLQKNGFPCRVEEASAGRIDPVADLVGIGQFADADRSQLLCLTMWLAASIRSRRAADVIMDDRGPLAWVPVRLSTEHVEFDTSSLETEEQVHEVFTFTSKDGLTRVERDKNLIGIIGQGRFRLLANECAARGIELDCLGACIPGWIAHVERYEKGKGFGSHQFWNGLRVELELDGVIGCCPLVAPSSLPYSSWDGMSADWGFQLQPKRPIYDFLCASPELQQRLAWKLTAERPWFALTRRATLDRTVKQGMERAGQVVTVYKKGSRVAACKGSFRTGQLRAIQSNEDWCVWASRAAIGTGAQEDLVRRLKQRLDSILLTADGVVPLDLACLSSREAQLGPAGAAYVRSGIVAATDGSLRKSGAMGAAYVTKDNRLPPRSVAVFGQPSSIRPELTGIALALEDCPGEEDLNILTDSLSSMRLLKSMQREDFPLQLYRHPVRQLLLHVVKLINKRAESGRATRLIKVRAHRGEPLNERADALAAAAAQSDPARPLAVDQDPEVVYFLHKEMWVEWDARLREDLVQRAAKCCVARLLRPRRGRRGAEASPPTLTLTAAWMLRPNQGRSTLGQVLGEMRISAAKKQILQSIAGAFPGNAVLYKWRIAPSPACTLCGHPAETQSHIQCLCPALQEARIKAHHNIAKRLWQGIRAVTKGWVITTEQTVEGLLGLPQPEEQIDVWQRAWDELTDVDLEGEGWDTDAEAAIQRKRPDAWAVHWGKRNLLILEFTRPNDRGETALRDTDAYKTDRYTPLKNRLAGHLAGWTVGILTFTIGIRGSYDLDRWYANLTCFGLTATQTDCLMRELVAQTLTELTDLYSVRYAALQQHHKAPNA